MATKKTVTKKSSKKKTVAKKVKLKNRIALVLDKSGSMISMQREVIDAYNAQLKTLKKTSKGMETKLSIYTFADTVAKLLDNRPIKEAIPLNTRNYMPNGMTALNDAIGIAIRDFEALPEANDPDCSFLLVILTDGQENSSKEFNPLAISSSIKRLENTKRWTFTYLGAGQNLHAQGASLGFSAGNMATGAQWTTSGAYTLTATASMGNFMKSRASGQTAVSNFYQDATQTAAIAQVPEDERNKQKK